MITEVNHKPLVSKTIEQIVIASLTEKARDFHRDFDHKSASAWILDILSAANDSDEWKKLSKVENCTMIDTSRVAIEFIHELPVQSTGDAVVSDEKFKTLLGSFDVYSPGVVADSILKMVSVAMSSETAEIWQREDRLRAVDLCRHLSGMFALCLPMTLHKEY